MIQDGFLTHPSANPAFWHWEPSNPLLQAVLVAVLTTILSYQFTALIFDICLSLKPRGNAPLRDIHVLLIAEESSPLAASAALFHSPTLSRWRFHGFRGHCPHQVNDLTPDPEHVSPRLFSLFAQSCCFFCLLHHWPTSSPSSSAWNAVTPSLSTTLPWQALPSV